MKNQDIRKALKRRGLYLWQLCNALGISEATMTRKLRNELSDKEKSEMMKVIAEIEVE